MYSNIIDLLKEQGGMLNEHSKRLKNIEALLSVSKTVLNLKGIPKVIFTNSPIQEKYLAINNIRCSFSID
jgi:hypothetical protein